MKLTASTAPSPGRDERLLTGCLPTRTGLPARTSGPRRSAHRTRRSAAAAAAAPAGGAELDSCRRRARRTSSSGTGRPAPGRATGWWGSAGSGTARSRRRRACRSSSRRGSPAAPMKPALRGSCRVAGSTRTTTTGDPRSSLSAPCGKAVTKLPSFTFAARIGLPSSSTSARPACHGVSLSCSLDPGAEGDHGYHDRGRQPGARDARRLRRSACGG